MRVFVIYFGTGRYIPLLEQFFAGWYEHATARLEVLTDPWSVVPGGMPLLRVDPSPWLAKYFRAGKLGAGFDYKACLQLAWGAEVREPAAFFDCDNVVYGDPLPALRRLPSDRLCIGTDPGLRRIAHPVFAQPVVEESTSTMLLPADARSLCDKYRELWDSRTEEHELLEQRTWSLVVRATHGVIMPRELSWSTRWGKVIPEGVLIEHMHGPRKWDAIK